MLTLYMFFGVFFGFLGAAASVHFLVENGPLSENESINMLAVCLLAIVAGLVVAAIWPLAFVMTFGYSLYLLYRKFA